MSLRSCRDCGDKVSTKAGKCPHCGTPNVRHRVEGCFAVQNGCTVIIAIVLLLAVVGVFGGVCV